MWYMCISSYFEESYKSVRNSKSLDIYVFTCSSNVNMQQNILLTFSSSNFHSDNVDVSAQINIMYD